MKRLQRLYLPLLTAIFLMPLKTDSQAQGIAPYFLGDRILIDGKINQQPVRFVFDTGASFSAMFGTAAERLGVEIESTREDFIADHPVQIGFSKPLDFAMFGHELKTEVRILMSPAPSGIDGVLSWRNVSAPILQIDGYERKVGTLNQLPITGWQRWQLEKETPQLFFVVTKEGKPLGRVFVDTGAAIGLRLSPPLWQAWRDQNPGAKTTLETFRYSVGDVMVHELAWADEYALGDLAFRNVDIGPIPEAKDDKAIDAGGKEFIATIGIRALRQLRMIISHRSDEVWTQSVSLVPDHNRLGAVFMRGPEDNSAFVGRILKDSPAERAGLKDGDVLLEINGVDFSTRRQASGVNPASFVSQPAGTQLNLKVERTGATHEISVRLQDLIGAEVK